MVSRQGNAPIGITLWVGSYTRLCENPRHFAEALYDSREGLREGLMGRFIEGADRRQAMLLPEAIEDYVGEENPVRVIDAFVEMLDLVALGFEGVIPEETGRPSYHPATMLRIYVYGYLNQVQSSRGLERECHRNLELI